MNFNEVKNKVKNWASKFWGNENADSKVGLETRESGLKKGVEIEITGLGTIVGKANFRRAFEKMVDDSPYVDFEEM